MKSERGMSHIMVFLSIVVMVTILVLGIFFVKDVLEKEQLETLKTNMVSIQVKVKVLAEEVTVKKEGVAYLGKKLSENAEDEDVKNLIEKNVISQEEENYEEYYILEKEDLNTLKLKNISINKVVVNYKTYEIILVEGFKIKENTYYKLSDFNNIDKVEENTENAENIVNEEIVENNETENSNT